MPTKKRSTAAKSKKKPVATKAAKAPKRTIKWSPKVGEAKVLEFLGAKSGPQRNVDVYKGIGVPESTFYKIKERLLRRQAVRVPSMGHLELVAGAASVAGKAPTGTSSPKAEAVVAKPKSVRKAAAPSAPQAVAAPQDGADTDVLAEALTTIQARLGNVARLKTKLLVLEKLSKSMPAPVAEVLKEIAQDLRPVAR